MVSYRTIQSFDHSCTLNMFMSMELYQTQTLLLAKKLFLSYLRMRIHRMQSLLTRSDRFHVDLLTTFVHTPTISKITHTCLKVMLEYELKYGFMFTRFHGDLWSKDHLHNFHLENHLWHASKVSIKYFLSSSQFSRLIFQMSTHIFVLVSHTSG